MALNLHRYLSAELRTNRWFVGCGGGLCADGEDQVGGDRDTDLDALSRPTLGFPADVMREASVVAGVYGAQLPDIDDPRAEAVRRTTSGT
jgi:hypothetical protein